MDVRNSVTELHHPNELTVQWISNVFGEEIPSFTIDKKGVATDDVGTLSSLVGITVHTRQRHDIKVVAKFPCLDTVSNEFVNKAGLDTREAAFYKYAATAMLRIAKPHQIHMPLIPCFLPLRSPLIMEDLRPKGFRLADPVKGLSTAEAQHAMSALARFHAAGMMVKETLDDGANEKKNAAMHEHLQTLVYNGTKLTQKKLAHMDDDSKILAQYLDNVIVRRADLMDFKPHEPFISIAHIDLWVNNLIFQYSKDNLVKDCVLLDWQFWSPRGSVGLDVTSVLLSGLTPSDYKNKAVDLLKYYHTQLINTLTQLGCESDVLKSRSFTALQKHCNSQIEPTAAMLLCAAPVFHKTPEMSKRMIHIVREAYLVSMQNH